MKMNLFCTRGLVLMAVVLVTLFAMSSQAEAGPIVRLVQRVRANCQARQAARQEARHGHHGHSHAPAAAGCACGPSCPCKPAKAAAPQCKDGVCFPKL